MNKSLWQRLTPHAIAIGIFFIVSCLYCMPALKGLVVAQHDVQGWKGMAQQSFEFKEKYGHFPLWTQSMFSGMPAFQIALESNYNVTIAHLHHLFILFLPSPAGLFFLACVGFYILTVVLGIGSWVGIFGSLGYAFASYNAIIVVVGHLPKFASMGYAPAVLAGLILLTQRKYVLGFITTLLFSTLLAFQNHAQIVYYTLLIALCVGIAYAVHAFKTKQVRHLGITAGLALLAGIMGVASFAVMYMPTADYAKETMRGGRSELTQASSPDKANTNKSKGGLDKEYAFGWSYGISETMTIILPSYKGGSSGPTELGDEGKAVQALQEAQLPGDAVNYFYGNFLSSYWGDQPGTSGPVYFGALVCLFFIIGLFVVRSWHLNWIIPATIIGIVLAWGSNFKAVNYFLFDYLPFYNKFRAPSIALVIAQLTFPLLASMALHEILYGNWDKQLLLKRLKYAFITTGVVAAILVVTYIGGEFKGKNDRQVREAIASTLTQAMSRGQQPSQEILQQNNTVASAVMNGVANDRKSLYASDLLRTLVFLIVGAGLTWLAVQKKTKAIYIAIAFVALNLIDLLPVSSRYLNKDKYVEQEDFNTVFAPTNADLQIKQDTSYYRVFNTMGDPFQSSDATSRTAYLHNSVGGYHPAKLALYDDLISHQLRKGNMNVFNMLNTKYFIVSNPADQQPAAQQNPGALGPAWLVKKIVYVNNADEEMKALDAFTPADTVIIDKREQSKIPFIPQFDSLASIQFIQTTNDKLTYQFNAGSNQFVVFSEVYYPRGWKAYIDSKEAPIVKVNYVLRGLAVPAGKHSIELRFEPQSFKTGDMISLIVGILSILIFLAGAWWIWRDIQRENKTARKADNA
jgi:Bacterial membrane protein YfhO